MPTEQTINAVLSFMMRDGGREFGPLELINALKTTEGVEESKAKEAISFLINDHQVEMTENRRLRAFALVG